MNSFTGWPHYNSDTSSKVAGLTMLALGSAVLILCIIFSIYDHYKHKQ